MRAWAWLLLPLLCGPGCREFVAAGPVVDSTGSAGPRTSGAPQTESDSTTLDSDSPAGTASTTAGTGPDGSESKGAESGLDPGGSTSQEPSSTTSGVAPPTTGDDSSTGEVVRTCSDLVLPDLPPPVCSLEALDLVNLSIDNDCVGVAVDVYWVDYNCNEIFFARVDPGGSWGIVTFQTHPWRIRNVDTGELMRETPPLTMDTSLAVLQR